jgi:hypothetical protein
MAYDTDDTTLPADHQIGANNPPSPIDILKSELAEETEGHRARAKLLAETAKDFTVDSEEKAERGTAMAAMLRGCANAIEESRKERKQLPWEQCRTIDMTFKEIYFPLVGADPAKPAGLYGALVNGIDVYRRKREEEAAAKRRELEAAETASREKAAQVLRDAEAAAERDRIKLEQAQATLSATDPAEREKAAREVATLTRTADVRRITTETVVGAALAKADTYAAQAATTVAAPLDSGLGAKAFGRKETVFTIDDFGKALAHARKIDPDAIRTAVEEIITRQIKAKVKTFPGVTFTETSKTVVRS